MRLAKWVFLLAGSTGILMVMPPYFLEQQLGRDNPPPVNHPEFYYGFLGVTLAWQLMFLVIGSDPIRFRKAMLPAMLEKASFAIAIPILYVLERVAVTWVGFAAMDAMWLVLFIVAYRRTPKEAALEASYK
jgi:hypothetical protein